MSQFLKQRVQATNDLGFQLLGRLTDDKGAAGQNVFISPLSIMVALAMTFNGADGEAKEALAKILGLSTHSRLEDLNQANAELLSSLAELNPEVVLSIANSLWLQEGMTLAPEFARQMADSYDGKIANIDFSDPAKAAEEINRWVAAKTQQMIPRLLSADNVREAILVLVNAIYFKGEWATPFDKDETADGEFTDADGNSRQLPMMRQSGQWMYSDTEMYQAIVLPYGQHRIGMHIVLPKPDIPLDEFRRYLTAERFQSWPSRAHPTPGEIKMPRFKAGFKKDIVLDLMDLGGKGLRGSGFPHIGVGDLMISCVIHEAVLEVNEEGSEAAAATAVTMTRGGDPGIPFTMRVDRPFFCAICDRENWSILFMGWILAPE